MSHPTAGRGLAGEGRGAGPPLRRALEARRPRLPPQATPARSPRQPAADHPLPPTEPPRLNLIAVAPRAADNLEWTGTAFAILRGRPGPDSAEHTSRRPALRSLARRAFGSHHEE